MKASLGVTGGRGGRGLQGLKLGGERSRIKTIRAPLKFRTDYSELKLPKSPQVRSGELGRASRTKYTHLSAEDTSRKDSLWFDEQSSMNSASSGFLAAKGWFAGRR
jgi:Microfibril-associated/Pre-mRNA processing